MEAMESASANVETFSMFLYMGILAPVTEEILFRGLVQRSLMPYGKKFAIFGSAFLFGIFHGNLVQTPYAFLVGLILGYVASEYSIAWAMLLHLINNMILGDSFNRLTSSMPEELANLIFLIIVGGCAVAGIIVMICKRKKIAADLGDIKISGRCVGCFFTNFGIIVLTILMVGKMILMLFI
jgi:membrane protease YdiL (CAAX protease family)